VHSLRWPATSPVVLDRAAPVVLNDVDIFRQVGRACLQVKTTFNIGEALGACDCSLRMAALSPFEWRFQLTPRRVWSGPLQTPSPSKDVPVCQWPVVSAHGRPVDVPAGGQ
jgi:hypothetical protein